MTACELPDELRERLVQNVREHPNRCPSCGSEKLGWDGDNIVTPTVSRQNCKECGCIWSPQWRARNGWGTALIGIFFVVVLGVFGTTFLVYQVVAGQFEYVRRWYNLSLPRSWEPYLQIAICLAGAFFGLIMIRKGFRVVKGKGSGPVIHAAGESGTD